MEIYKPTPDTAKIALDAHIGLYSSIKYPIYLAIVLSDIFLFLIDLKVADNLSALV